MVQQHVFAIIAFKKWHDPRSLRLTFVRELRSIYAYFFSFDDTVPFAASLAFLFLGIRQLVSHPYSAPLPNTNADPSIIFAFSWCPKSNVLMMNDTSLRMFSTIVTVTADDLAESRLTPEMHASWVTALVRRNRSP